MDAQLRGVAHHIEGGAFGLLTSKLAPPFTRPGLVERTALLDRLASEAAPVASVTAAAGYGKTTLLRQWADRSGRRTAWVTLDSDDNDPVVLLTYLTAALDGVEPIDPELFRLLAVDYPSVSSITRRLGSAFAAWSQPGALILDDAHVLENPTCHDIVATLVAHVPTGSQVALGSRTQPPLPMARLRAQGRVVEVGPDDLALDYAEAGMLLHGAGVELPEADVRDLVDLVEGWPVAVYLAGRSARARGRGATLDLAHIGQSRDIVEYAHAELLSTLSGSTVQFLTRSSVLVRMSGPLCDKVVRTFDSAARLEGMVRSSLLVTPLDEHRGWYRYHHLFRDLLRAELNRREPALARELNRRASTWCEAHDLPDAAVDYAMAAGDANRAARIVQRRGLTWYRTGRTATLRRLFDWFESNGNMDRHPGVSVLGTWVAALTGRPAAAERWADAVARANIRQDTIDDGAPAPEGQAALVRALLCRDGIDQALVDAATAVHLIPADDIWRATALTLYGIVQLCAGSHEDADENLIEAVEVGRDLGAVPAVSVALAERALIALDHDDPAEAHTLAAQACGAVGDGRLQDLVTNVFVFSVAARIAIRDGDAARAERWLTQAQRLRPQLTYAIPCLAVQSRVELIRTMLNLADGPGARTVLREVDHILRLRPNLGVLMDQVRQVRAQTAGTPVGTIGASSLTVAELRLLPLLQTHLKLREIGERLFVSPHTVKTQAISIYRKLGVSSRSDAMRVASEVGLLPD